MTQHMSGTWKAIDIEIYEVDDLGNPGSFIAMARDQRVAARMADMHNSMLAALKELEEFLDNQADVDDGRPNDAMRHLVEVRTAIAKAEGTKP